MATHEKRLSKLQILVTDTELQNIDDWRFDNRAENRSSAVRELIALGLSLALEKPDEAAERLKKLRGDN
ncbi:MAG: hypothetical protein AAGA39_09355 [Pseudomonadota bacterium]